MTALAELGICFPETVSDGGSNDLGSARESVFTGMDIELHQGKPESLWMQERLRPEITSLGLRGYFNPAVIEMRDGTLTLLARHVEKAAKYGLPDEGALVQITLMHDGSQYQVLRKEQIWEPADSPHALIEDVRALNNLKGKDERVFLGATVVMDHEVVGTDGNRKVEKTPFGAIAILNDESQIPDAPTKFRPCPELGPGKNMTPIDMEGNFLFREEGKDGDHNFILSIIHYDQATGTVKKTGELDFREHMKDIKWGKWRIGTTAALPADGDTQVLVIHGISTEPTTKNPYGKKYDYSVGLACLEKLADGTLGIVGVDPQPMAVPDDFSDESQGVRIGEQLHPELRDAIYLCGQVTRTDGGIPLLHQFLSYGDTETVLGSYPVEAVWERNRRIYESAKLAKMPIAA